MSRIEVTISSSSIRPTHCIVMIANCDARHVDTRRQRMINGEGVAQFNDIPPGTYYIVVVPEGENARHVRFKEITGPLHDASVTIDLTVVDPVGKIIATVLVDGHGTGGYIVKIKCAENKYENECMTDQDGVATFHGVPDGQLYNVTASCGSVSQADICDMRDSEEVEIKFNFPN